MRAQRSMACVLGTHSLHGCTIEKVIYELRTLSSFRTIHSLSYIAHASTTLASNISSTQLELNSNPSLSSTPSPYRAQSRSRNMTRTNNSTSASPSTRVDRSYLQGNAQRARTYSQSQSRRSSVHGSAALQIHWLFRSSLPRRRGSSSPIDNQKRTFFGMGEIIGVLANVSVIHMDIYTA